MPSLCGLGKRPQGILRNQSTRGFFGFEFSFENCFCNVFSTSGLSQIYKITNVWKLSRPFSRNTLLPHALKNLLGVLKHHFGKKKLSRELKNSRDNFAGVWDTMVLVLLV
jgi:hypothetical protein